MNSDAIEPEHNELVAAEQLLSRALGGWRGLVDSGLPTIVFLLVFNFTSQNISKSASAAFICAGVLAVVRLIERKSLQQVLSGVIAVAISAWFANRTGNPADYFVPSMFKNAGYALGIALSILVGWPALGFVIGGFQADLIGWRQQPEKLRKYKLISWWWVGMFALRLAIQLPLYRAGQLDLLGTANIFLGYPLFLAVVWATYRAIATDKA